MSRPDYPPGTIVEHRQRFIVRTDRYGQHHRKHAGARKLQPVGDVEVVEVGRVRWRVYRMQPGMWVASGSVPGAWTELAPFGTHAAAIAYADRMARKETR